MKKTYIAPALSLHKLNIESSLLGPSQYRRVDFGNKPKKDVSPCEYVPDVEQFGIDPIEGVEGDDWSTL